MHYIFLFSFFFFFWIVIHYSFAVYPECDEIHSGFSAGRIIQGEWSKQKSNSIVRGIIVNMRLNGKYLLVVSSTDLFRVYSQNYSQKSWKWHGLVSFCKTLSASWIWRGITKRAQTILTFSSPLFQNSSETSENLTRMLGAITRSQVNVTPCPNKPL